MLDKKTIWLDKKTKKNQKKPGFFQSRPKTAFQVKVGSLVTDNTSNSVLILYRMVARPIGSTYSQRIFARISSHCWKKSKR